MSTVTLRWIGDLDQDKREQAGCVSSSSDQYRPKKIELKPGQKEIRIGRINTKIPPDYPIESCINSRMISRNHATIERSAKGGSILYDHSMNGTYVNYTRVMGGVTLKHGDIVCFGHLNGANLKPGEPVALFYSDLKYRVSPLIHCIRSSYESSSFVCVIFNLVVCLLRHPNICNYHRVLSVLAALQ
ncbi:uncharacterized protein DC041_0007108 [Schistosoma bovis]|uniref:FHA domain-containing protein n=1 Tax=Schistosoma bovis TaxID=6184 RepID=A0A430Q4S4_SCHBO|nr:uncharacterized protein DC041_0007108 [Schistosoma bovis]